MNKIHTEKSIIVLTKAEYEVEKNVSQFPQHMYSCTSMCSRQERSGTITFKAMGMGMEYFLN